MSPEFRLLAACCRWPDDASRKEAICRSISAGLVWIEFERLASYHRVEGLVAHGLRYLEGRVPLESVRRLDLAAVQIKQHALLEISDMLRIGHYLDNEAIQHRFLKGAALGVIAYGTPTIKRSWDIDLLVPPSECIDASQCLARLGFEPYLPNRQLNKEEFARWSTVSKEAIFKSNRGTFIELHWRLGDHPQLIQNIDALSQGRPFRLLGSSECITLCDAENIAYLAVHGSTHGWFRLKWLADFSAFVNSLGESRDGVIESGAKLGVGCTLNAAFILMDFIFGEKPSRDIVQAMPLAKLCLGAMTARNEEVANKFSSRARLRLDGTFRFLFVEIFIRMRGTVDRLDFRLHPRLFFAYPLLRVPFWIWRRAVRPVGRLIVLHAAKAGHR